jgi:hypothetical protein
MPLLTPDRGALLRDLRFPGVSTDRTFRIAIAAGASIFRWEREAIERLAAIPGFALETVKGAAIRSPDSPSRIGPSVLFDTLYRRSCEEYDPFGRVALAAPLAPKDGLPDIAIWLPSATMPSGACAGIARFGVLSFGLGSQSTFPPYWDEALRRDPATFLALQWHSDVFERMRVVSSAELASFQGLHFTRNAENPLKAAAHLAIDLCAKVRFQGEAWKGESGALAEQTCTPFPVARSSDAQVATFVAGRLARSARLRMRSRGRQKAWFIALRRDTSQSYASRGKVVPAGLTVVPMTRGREMADPFLLERDGRTFMFFEEVLMLAGKGRLAVLEILDNGTLTPPEVIMETDDHVSYPCVFGHRGDVFMIPETGAAASVDLYRATKFPSEFTLEKKYLAGFGFTDTTPILLDGVWYFFTTAPQTVMETYLFHSDRLDGEWKLHPRSPISSSVRNSRSAGHIMRVNGRLLRPTQDCSMRYGYAMTINEITRLTPREFEERPVDHIKPSWMPGLICTHTLNSSSKYEVLDGGRYRE